MRALGVRGRPGVGGLARALEWLELPVPEPGRREARVSPRKGRGPWAEYCTVNAANLLPIPAGWSFREAGALGIAAMVACALLAKAGAVQGRRIRVVGASGGIGTLATAAGAAQGAEMYGVCSGG
jgi:NADPH:quinone reductase-like Zn-dependent oxidoreductase